MAGSVTLSLDSVGVGAAADDRPKYWSAEHHGRENYLRAEEWVPDVREFMFDGARTTVPLTHEAATAILRYREDAKMFAALRDAQRAAAGARAAADAPPEALHHTSVEDFVANATKHYVNPIMAVQTGGRVVFSLDALGATRLPCPRPPLHAPSRTSR